MESSSASPGAASAAGGVAGRLGNSGTRAAAERGPAASSPVDRVGALDAREADADPAVGDGEGEGTGKGGALRTEERGGGSQLEKRWGGTVMADSGRPPRLSPAYLPPFYEPVRGGQGPLP